MNITSRKAHRIALAFLAMCALTCATLTTDAAMADTPRGHSVSLSQAATPPTFLAILPPGQLVAPAYCGYDGQFSDVSAYTWQGGAMSAQHWTTDRTLMYWLPLPKGKRAGRVSFDGRIFRNTTRASVIVAGWCEQ